MAFDSPLIFHTLLNTITDSVIEYVKYQAGYVFRTTNRSTFMTKCVKVFRAKAKAKSMDQSQARIWV
jgi:hypothetical protein